LQLRIRFGNVGWILELKGQLCPETSARPTRLLQRRWSTKPELRNLFVCGVAIMKFSILAPLVVALLFVDAPLIKTSADQAHAYSEGDPRLNRWLGVNTRRTRWCGLYLAKIVRNPPRAAASVASWRGWGKRTSCRAGTVAIFKHNHVGKVMAVKKGQMLVKSGNDGNAIRTRWRRASTVSHCRVN
jgi:hypothetical protein